MAAVSHAPDGADGGVQGFPVTGVARSTWPFRSDTASGEPHAAGVPDGEALS